MKNIQKRFGFLFALIVAFVFLVNVSVAGAEEKYYWSPERGYQKLLPFAQEYMKRGPMAGFALAQVTTSADIVNLDYVSKKVGITKKEARKRINSWLERRLLNEYSNV